MRNIVKVFQVDDLGEVKLRYPSIKDARGMKKHFNSMVEEGAEITDQVKVNMNEEIDYLSNHLKEIMKGNQVGLVVDFDGNILGYGFVTKKEKAMSHVGKLAIGLKKDAREKASERNY